MFFFSKNHPLEYGGLIWIYYWSKVVMLARQLYMHGGIWQYTNHPEKTNTNTPFTKTDTQTKPKAKSKVVMLVRLSTWYLASWCLPPRAETFAPTETFQNSNLTSLT